MPVFVPGQKFGIFTYIGPEVHMAVSDLKKLGQFKCQCGAVSQLSFKGVIYNPSTRCTKCSYVMLESGTRFGKLEYVGPTTRIARSAKTEFVCTCGRHKHISLSSVIRGVSRSCGQCSTILLSHGMTRGKLTYDGPDIEVKPGSYAGVWWSCSCGGRIKRSLKSVFSARIAGCDKGCGKCQMFHLENGDKYKHFIYVDQSIDISPSSTKSCLFKCRCGLVKSIQIQSITRGQKTCGQCFRVALSWYERNREVLRSAKSFSINDFPVGGLRPLTDIQDATHPFVALCPLCGNRYGPRLRDIKRGVSLSCGCTNFTISGLNTQLAQWLNDSGVQAVSEHRVGGFKYDVAVLEAKLLIEINGLHWHSMSKSKVRDLAKFKHAGSCGYVMLTIYEDEWVFKGDIMRVLIANKVGLGNTTSVRASACTIKHMPGAEVDSFYEQFHYLGKAKSGMNMAAVHEGKIVACMSFKRPTRQTSKYDWELVRMTSLPTSRVHGVWSRLFRAFVNEVHPSSVVSFSDNRLFTGGVYSKIGFALDGELQQDYYWTKQRRRWHKSSLRKTDAEKMSGMTETELREAQGYRKIWDLGKKRWVWRNHTDV